MNWSSHFLARQATGELQQSYVWPPECWVAGVHSTTSSPLHGCWISELWSSCLHGKLFQLLRHLPSSCHGFFKKCLRKSLLWKFFMPWTISFFIALHFSFTSKSLLHLEFTSKHSTRQSCFLASKQ